MTGIPSARAVSTILRRSSPGADGIAISTSSGRWSRISRAELVGRAEHPDAVDAEVALARVVVDEADRRVGEPRVALHLADDELAGVAGADDEHLLAARDDPAFGALDQRAREQPRAGDERQQQQVVERDDRASAGGEVSSGGNA